MLLVYLVNGCAVSYVQKSATRSVFISNVFRFQSIQINRALLFVIGPQLFLDWSFVCKLQLLFNYTVIGHRSVGPHESIGPFRRSEDLHLLTYTWMFVENPKNYVYACCVYIYKDSDLLLSTRLHTVYSINYERLDSSL